jgi:hypothetical protein
MKESIMSGKVSEEKKGWEVIKKMCDDIFSHPAFDKWCITSQLDAVSEELRRGLKEIDALLVDMRACFDRSAQGMGVQQFEKLIRYFNDHGIKMVDELNNVSDQHFVNIKLVNNTGSLFVYNSATTIGR